MRIAAFFSAPKHKFINAFVVLILCLQMILPILPLGKKLKAAGYAEATDNSPINSVTSTPTPAPADNAAEPTISPSVTPEPTTTALPEVTVTPEVSITPTNTVTPNITNAPVTTLTPSEAPRNSDNVGFIKPEGILGIQVFQIISPTPTPNPTPVVTITNPTDGSLISNSISLEGIITGTDNATYTWYISDGGAINDVISGPHDVAALAPVNFATNGYDDGVYSLKLRVTYGSNQTSEDSHTVTIINNGSINGVKYLDDNGNHLLDANIYEQTSMPGFNFDLYILGLDGAWLYQTSDYTNEERNTYSFTGLVAGTYLVCENIDVESRWMQTAPIIGANPANEEGQDSSLPLPIGVTNTTDSNSNVCWHIVINQPNEENRNIDFGNFEGAGVRGRKYEMVAEGAGWVKDPTGLSGWTIFIDLNKNGIFDEGELSAITDESGFYSIDNIPQGNYNLCEVNKPGWGQYIDINNWLPNTDQNTWGYDMPGCYAISIPHSGTDLSFGESTVYDFINYQDVIAPTINGVPNQVYNEGDYINNWEVFNGRAMQDEMRLKDFYFQISFTPVGRETRTLPVLMIDASDTFDNGLGGTLNQLIEYETDTSAFDFATWNGKVPVDTSVIPEGVYSFTYWVTDQAGNESICTNDSITIPTIVPTLPTNTFQAYSLSGNTRCHFTVTINNVKPIVALGSNQTILERQTANFTGSFSDPSYMESSVLTPIADYLLEPTGLKHLQTQATTNLNDETGPNRPDDGKWITYFNYGDGHSVNLGTMTKPGSIEIPGHVYAEIGTYTATLTVCEGSELHNTEFLGLGSGDLISGEGNCTSASVKVNVLEADAETVIVLPDSTIRVEQTTYNNYTPEPTATPIPTVTPTGTPKVLGLLSCDKQSKVSGYIFLDKNGNGLPDIDEQRFAKIDVTITYFDKDGKEQVAKVVTTDEFGKWEADICPGDYKVKIAQGALASSESLKDGSVMNITVKTEEPTTNVNFIVQEVSGFNWWLLCIPLCIALIILVIVVAYLNRKRIDIKVTD